MASVISYSGHQYLRQRLVLSILSGKPVRIDKIRSEHENPGLTDYEVSLLRLLEKVTNGTVIEISVTGTAVLLKPGVITGGSVTHDCPLSRAIGYFLEPLVMLGPFSKKPFHLTLRGITTDQDDLSADLIRTVTLPHLQLFGISEGLELRIKRRGAPPGGGGEVQFLCPVVKQVKTLNFVEPGKIKRIRGIAHAVRVSPQFSNRMIDAARLTTSAVHCAEAVSQPGGTPEDVALLASRALLSEIRQGGCVLLMMVLGSEDVGRCRMGEPTVRTVQFLRDIRDFFGTSFKITRQCTELMYSCYGTGYVNVNRTLA
ncbi:RNA 3'-terminal phosphate cyclase domain-containing protein [Pisolithus orientalis]|uniref:RNA 3'-terminal phosphate cyclase domain-containing protein n=1 Tax=Pisolithus orientalis TaxID=936130 RepID=UPI002224B81F|nr:RNA 3'-terminal phosphate cyclase domain-containing protein [Pisolithus orientalis]KAI6028649.1 RNA 3'-terminal phosphate cyclase domain-containing protein [Pisolithus orientalis]